MKVDQLFGELKLLAEKLGVEVSEQNFRTTGIAVRSGFCKVKDRDLFLIDKHLKKTKKVEVLAEHLAQLSLATISVSSDLKTYLAQYRLVHSIPDSDSEEILDTNKMEIEEGIGDDPAAVDNQQERFEDRLKSLHNIYYQTLLVS